MKWGAEGAGEPGKNSRYWQRDGCRKVYLLSPNCSSKTPPKKSCTKHEQSAELETMSGGL